jgi:uncharacterized phage infection (PIP) family protein YhgE
VPTPLFRLRELVGNKLGFTWSVILLLGVVLILLGGPAAGRRLLLLTIFLGVYFLYGLSLERKNVATFADSIYFMGFLWTLVALIDVLLPGRLTAAMVFKGFGYALVTTAVGMFLRLVVLQFQESVPDRMIDAQREVEEAITAFTEELKEGAGDINRFRELANKKLNEELDQLSQCLVSIRAEIQRSHTQEADASVSAMRATADAVIEHLKDFEVPRDKLRAEANKVQQTFARLVARMEEATAGLGEAAERAADRLRAATEGLSDRLTRLEVPTDLFVRAGGQLEEELRKTIGNASNSIAADLRSLGQSVSALREQLGALVEAGVFETISARLTDAVRDLSDRERELADRWRAVSEALQPVTGRLAAVTDLLGRLHDGLHQLHRQVQNLGDAGIASLAGHIANAERGISEARQAGAQLHQAVEEVLRFLRRRLAREDLL